MCCPFDVACTAVPVQKHVFCVCGDGGREVIRLQTDPENQGTGAYLLLTPYTHGVPHVDCEGPCAATRTSLLLPPACFCEVVTGCEHSKQGLQLHILHVSHVHVPAPGPVITSLSDLVHMHTQSVTCFCCCYCCGLC
jgi:hypothetical protein